MSVGYSLLQGDWVAATEALHRLDTEVRAASPKCVSCGRPDGGVLPSGCTAFEAGLVDRRRCPETECPMRGAPEHFSLLVSVGLPS